MAPWKKSDSRGKGTLWHWQPRFEGGGSWRLSLLWGSSLVLFHCDGFVDTQRAGVNVILFHATSSTALVVVCNVPRHVVLNKLGPNHLIPCKCHEYVTDIIVRVNMLSCSHSVSLCLSQQCNRHGEAGDDSPVPRPWTTTQEVPHSHWPQVHRLDIAS